MRILIDTNILIHLEDNRVVDDTFYKVYNLAVANNCEILYHKACLQFIWKYSIESITLTIVRSRYNDGVERRKRH